MSNEGGGRLPGLLLVLSAPSGGGKTTVAHRYREGEQDALFSISATTRRPRGAERDGVDYHFLSEERFTELVEEGAFAEWARVHGRRYGTLRKTVEDALEKGRVALFDIDVQGGASVKSRWPSETATVFLLPPSPEELERRLRGRSTETEESVAQRLAAAWAEVGRGLATYDYVIVNDALEQTVDQLALIARCERLRRAGVSGGEAEAAARLCRRGFVSLPAWEKRPNPT